MNPSHTLLVATDLSGSARHAVDRAAWLARDGVAARLVLLHVVSMPALESLRRFVGAEEGDAALMSRLMERAEAQLASLARELEQRHGVAPSGETCVGRVLEAIVEAGVRHEADTLVLGARGANFVREFLLGSTAERVLRKAGRPVLAVKQHPHEPYGRVLVPVDFSDYSLQAARRAHALAPKAEITLLHAFEVEMESQLQLAGVDEDTLHRYRVRAKQRALAAMDELVARLDIQPPLLTRQVVHGPPSMRILEKEQELGADLIVIGKRGLSLLDELLLGSVTKHILAYSDCDVLVTGAPPPA